MRIRNLFLFTASLACFACIHAQNNLKVVLKGGSELVGYISSQQPGKSLTFAANQATVLLQGDSVESIMDNHVNVKRLSDAWKQWAEEHGALVGNGDDAYLALNDIRAGKSMIREVRILERGVKVKYLDLSDREHVLTWDSIIEIKAVPRPKLQLSGINRRYKLRSGMEYEGEYVGEVPGKTLSLLQDNGVVHVFDRDEVLKDNRYKVNPDQSLFEQSDLIDLVELRNGTSYKGIIIERNYSDATSASNGYLLIQSENGSVQSVDLADVKEYKKEINPHYAPLTDVDLAEGEFMVNRIPAKPLTVQEYDDVVCLPGDTVEVVIGKQLPSTEINIESRFANELQSSQWKFIKLEEFYHKKKKLKLYGLTYEDIVKKAIQPTHVATSVNGITKLTFALNEGGVYALYDSSAKIGLLFEVK